MTIISVAQQFRNEIQAEVEAKVEAEFKKSFIDLLPSYFATFGAAPLLKSAVIKQGAIFGVDQQTSEAECDKWLKAAKGAS
ncbi:MAG: hypothetical protein LBE49_03395 [Deltaproteobacteria bacterium]|jgi:hypothetical protein|nr:hypothetical protein [Deltaproteobacteria bacterium]